MTRSMLRKQTLAEKNVFKRLSSNISSRYLPTIKDDFFNQTERSLLHNKLSSRNVQDRIFNTTVSSNQSISNTPLVTSHRVGESDLTTTHSTFREKAKKFVQVIKDNSSKQLKKVDKNLEINFNENKIKILPDSKTDSNLIDPRDDNTESNLMKFHRNLTMQEVNKKELERKFTKITINKARSRTIVLSLDRNKEINNLDTNDNEDRVNTSISRRKSLKELDKTYSALTLKHFTKPYSESNSFLSVITKVDSNSEFEFEADVNKKKPKRMTTVLKQNSLDKHSISHELMKSLKKRKELHRKLNTGTRKEIFDKDLDSLSEDEETLSVLEQIDYLRGEEDDNNVLRLKRELNEGPLIELYDINKRPPLRNNNTIKEEKSIAGPDSLITSNELSEIKSVKTELSVKEDEAQIDRSFCSIKTESEVKELEKEKPPTPPSKFSFDLQRKLKKLREEFTDDFARIDLIHHDNKNDLLARSINLVLSKCSDKVEEKYCENRKLKSIQFFKKGFSKLNWLHVINPEEILDYTPVVIKEFDVKCDQISNYVLLNKYFDENTLHKIFVEDYLMDDLSPPQSGMVTLIDNFRLVKIPNANEGKRKSIRRNANLMNFFTHNEGKVSMPIFIHLNEENFEYYNQYMSRDLINQEGADILEKASTVINDSLEIKMKKEISRNIFKKGDVTNSSDGGFMFNSKRNGYNNFSIRQD